MDIPVDIEYDDIDTDRGLDKKPAYTTGVRVTCKRCGNQEECRGTSPDSIQRACDRLIISCPRREQNRYYAPEA